MIRLAAQSDDALLGPDVHVQHCKGISFEEAQILAETKTNVTTTPSWQQLHMRCPVPELLGLGVNVAVATDGTAPAMPFDLIRAARDTALLQQAAANDPSAERRILVRSSRASLPISSPSTFASRTFRPISCQSIS